MVSYTKESLDYLNSNYEVVGMAGTPWNAMGMDAWIASEHKNGREPHGVILLKRHRDTGRTISQENFRINAPLMEYFYGDDSEPISILSRLNQRLILLLALLKWHNPSSKGIPRKRITILSSALPDYSWLIPIKRIWKSHEIQFVIVDDGLTDPIKEGPKYGIWYRKTINKLIYKKFPVIDRRLITERKLDNRIVSDYIDVFKTYAPLLGKDLLSLYENSILVDTQAYAESGYLNGKDLVVYKNIYSILESDGLKNLVKPHPRELGVEKYEEIGYAVDKESRGLITQEVIIANLNHKPKCILSIDSAALNNAKLFFDIPAISLLKIMIKEDIGEKMKKVFKEEIEKYNGYWIMPESYNELSRVLGEL